MNFKNFSYYEFIELLIYLYKPSSYLELGVDIGRGFKKMELLVQRSLAVDIIKKFTPLKGDFFVGTTDAFFIQNNEMWDIIFIDACHNIDFVRRDLNNSLKVLSSKGICILHDTDPESMDLTTENFCSDAYKIVDEINTSLYFTYTFPITNGGLTILTLKTNRRSLEFI